MLAAAIVAAAVVLVLRHDTPVVVPPEPGAGATSSSRSPTPEPGNGPVAASLAGVVASATCVAPDSQDSAGNRTTYPASSAIDGDLTTAWRCDGDGSNESLRLSFPHPVELSAVGVVPGLAKTDPQSGVDRYAQNRRISAVRLTVDGGRALTASLDPSPTNRQVQWVPTGEVWTSDLTVTVLSTVPGIDQGDLPANETMAISEIEVS